MASHEFTRRCSAKRCRAKQLRARTGRGCAIAGYRALLEVMMSIDGRRRRGAGTCAGGSGFDALLDLRLIRPLGHWRNVIVVRFSSRGIPLAAASLTARVDLEEVLN